MTYIEWYSFSSRTVSLLRSVLISISVCFFDLFYKVKEKENILKKIHLCNSIFKVYHKKIPKKCFVYLLDLLMLFRRSESCARISWLNFFMSEFVYESPNRTHHQLLFDVQIVKLHSNVYLKCGCLRQLPFMFLLFIFMCVV